MLPRWLSGKESVYNKEATIDVGLIPGSGRSAGGGYGNTLQYFYQSNPMDRGAWWVIVHGVAESDSTEHSALSNWYKFRNQ